MRGLGDETGRRGDGAADRIIREPVNDSRSECFANDSRSESVSQSHVLASSLNNSLSPRPLLLPYFRVRRTIPSQSGGAVRLFCTIGIDKKSGARSIAGIACRHCQAASQ